MNKEKEKKLKHVKVYDRLYAMIHDGTFPAGTQLPSEPELASQMNVSRMTLRRALALLQEDDLVQNIQGKGNFIKEKSPVPSSVGLESMQHPFFACCNDVSDHTELEFRIEPPSDYIRESIGQNTAAVVIADRWYKKEEKAIGYTLSFLPIETISAYEIDLNEPASLLKFLDQTIYHFSTDSLCSYSYTNTGNFTATKYTISQQSSFILVQEILYGENHNVLLFNKHYIPIHHFKMEIHSTKH